MKQKHLVAAACWLCLAIVSALALERPVHAEKADAGAKGESIFFTPAGFREEGKAMWAKGDDAGKLRISVRDRSSGELIPCRICVVGSDGNFYQPPSNELSQHALVGDWPHDGARGNRKKIGPYRYVGRYFYSTGESLVDVPTGTTRVEVARGFEFAPQTVAIEVSEKQVHDVALELELTAAMSPYGYFNGDTHLHFVRASERDEKSTCDVLAAEDIQFGAILGYNHPPGPYAGFADKLDSPQLKGLGRQSLRTIGSTSILSGQEYRSKSFGHLNLFLLDDILFPSQTLSADDGPPYGEIALNARARGGISIHAHGGYDQEIYADAAVGAVDGVELLQFGVYRPIGLVGWYDILNSGYRFPCVGASDFPACRFLGDSRTYVWLKKPNSLREDVKKAMESPPRAEVPIFPDWLQALAKGQSFVTTGPLLLLEVEEYRPGEIVRYEGNARTVAVRILARSEVAPIEYVDLIVNGAVVNRFKVSENDGLGHWLRLEHCINLKESSWVAARAYGMTSEGLPNAESHTNPVYVYLNHRAPYRVTSLDAWLARLNVQLDKQSIRSMKHKEQVLAFYHRARKTLLEIRGKNGLMASDAPGTLVEQNPKNITPTIGN